MALILNIDTATETAGICLAKDGVSLGVLVNGRQQDHATWIQPAIQSLLQQTGFTLQQLDAVAVTAGPGSYTGLRVGLASAKGLCYALKIPLVTESTLRVMTQAALRELLPLENQPTPPHILLSPMIDARRMEVFTAVYDTDLQLKMPESAIILEEISFNELLSGSPVLFFGNGSAKWKSVCSHPHAYFTEKTPEITAHLAFLAEERFRNSQFSDLAYSEPAYLKEFYTYIKK